MARNSHSTLKSLQAQGIIPRGIGRGKLSLKDSARGYIRSLQVKIHGRHLGQVQDDNLDPIKQRTLLDKARREGQEIQNQVKLGELALIEVLEDVLMKAAEASATIHDTIPIQIERRCPHIKERDRQIIERIIAKARNQIADLKIDIPVQAAITKGVEPLN